MVNPAKPFIIRVPFTRIVNRQALNAMLIQGFPRSQVGRVTVGLAGHVGTRTYPTCHTQNIRREKVTYRTYEVKVYRTVQQVALVEVYTEREPDHLEFYDEVDDEVRKLDNYDWDTLLGYKSGPFDIEDVKEIE
tara:strand:+ start:109 stop:510 length:402 start_codon:yes stop_codon:yes gene_type:complete